MPNDVISRMDALPEKADSPRRSIRGSLTTFAAVFLFLFLAGSAAPWVMTLEIIPRRMIPWSILDSSFQMLADIRGYHAVPSEEQEVAASSEDESELVVKDWEVPFKDAASFFRWSFAILIHALGIAILTYGLRRAAPFLFAGWKKIPVLATACLGGVLLFYPAWSVWRSVRNLPLSQALASDKMKDFRIEIWEGSIYGGGDRKATCVFTCNGEAEPRDLLSRCVRNLWGYLLFEDLSPERVRHVRLPRSEVSILAARIRKCGFLGLPRFFISNYACDGGDACILVRAGGRSFWVYNYGMENPRFEEIRIRLLALAGRYGDPAAWWRREISCVLRKIGESESRGEIWGLSQHLLWHYLNFDRQDPLVANAYQIEWWNKEIKDWKAFWSKWSTEHEPKFGEYASRFAADYRETAERWYQRKVDAQAWSEGE